MFEQEKQRQRSSFVKRIEKIHVDVETQGENVQLMMNKFISTPYNCAMREYNNITVSLWDLIHLWKRSLCSTSVVLNFNMLLIVVLCRSIKTLKSAISLIISLLCFLYIKLLPVTVQKTFMSSYVTVYVYLTLF